MPTQLIATLASRRVVLLAKRCAFGHHAPAGLIFHRLPVPPGMRSDSVRVKGEANGKGLFMVRQTYLWPTYFYGRYKIYYFDLTLNDCVR